MTYFDIAVAEKPSPSAHLNEICEKALKRNRGGRRQPHTFYPIADRLGRPLDGTHPARTFRPKSGVDLSAEVVGVDGNAFTIALTHPESRRGFNLSEVLDNGSESEWADIATDVVMIRVDSLNPATVEFTHPRAEEGEGPSIVVGLPANAEFLTAVTESLKSSTAIPVPTESRHPTIDS